MAHSRDASRILLVTTKLEANNRLILVFAGLSCGMAEAVDEE